MIPSLYVHIPFCRTKCNYCSFVSYPSREKSYSAYVRSVLKELSDLADTFGNRTKLKSIFFGGGTPTVLDSEDIGLLLQQCLASFSIDDCPEISLEANPGTVDSEKLTTLYRAGFNRLSIGVQSFSEKELRNIGRCHTPREAIDCFQMARTAGFSNINLDLMYGLPDQTISQWQQNLEKALSLKPEHLSLYQLTVEEGTPLYDRFINGNLQLPDDDQILAMDALNLRLCEKAGLRIYEISNYAKSAFRCIHNVNYWHNGEYLAAGAGAVSSVEGRRERRCIDPSEYCRKVDSNRSCIIEREKLDRESSFRETVIMGLRMTDGIELDRLSARYGIDLKHYYGQILERLQLNGLVELSDTRLLLTKRGRKVSNSVLAELV